MMWGHTALHGEESEIGPGTHEEREGSVIMSDAGNQTKREALA
jgi:hypothetical protein